MKRFLSIGLLALAGACMAPPLLAQTNCAPRDQVVERLYVKYGETLQVNGLTSSGSIMEVYANHETRTWTILESDANGVACVAAIGDTYGEIFEPMGEDL